MTHMRQAVIGAGHLVAHLLERFRDQLEPEDEVLINVYGPAMSTTLKATTAAAAIFALVHQDELLAQCEVPAEDQRRACTAPFMGPKLNLLKT